MEEDRVPRRDMSTAVRANCVFTQGVTRVQWVDESAVEHSVGTYRVKINTLPASELRSCVTIEMAVLGSRP